ncbi:MAG TPA: TolC family protein [bacterium]|nr:TolC family protein [bacterium]
MKDHWKISAAVALLALATIGAGGARAQDASVTAAGGLTLEAAEQEALGESPDYRKALAQEREAGWGQLDALSSGFLPKLSIEGQHFFNQELFNGSLDNYTALSVQFPGSPSAITFPGIYPETSLTLSARLPIFDGFKNLHQMDAADRRHEAAALMSDQALLRLKEGVRLAYFKALASQLLSDMADQNVKTFDEHLRIVKDQLDNGQATKYDRLRVEVQLSEAQSGQIEAHDNLVLARMALARAMGLAKDERPLTGTLPVVNGDQVLKALPDHYEEGTELKAARLESVRAEDLGASADSFWFPQLSLFGQYQWYNTPGYILGNLDFNDYTSFQTDYFVGASLKWDILDGGLSLAKANEAHERAEQAKSDYRAAQLQAPYDFDLWKRRLISNVSLYQAKLTDVDKAKESVRLATVGFKAGTKTTTDLLDAELEEYRASAGLVQAQLNAWEALINLELVTGKRWSHD